MYEELFIGDWIYDGGHRPHGVLSLPLTDAHYVEIGRIAAHCGGCENLIQRLLWHLMGVSDARGKALSVATRTETQMDAIRLFLVTGRPRKKSHRQRIEMFLDEIQEVRRQRNDVLHSHWTYEHAPGTPIETGRIVAKKLSKKQGKPDTHIPHTPETLHKIASKAHQLYSEMAMFMVHELGARHI